MTPESWRYLDSGPQPGALNMATDEAMLEAYLRGDAPPTLRIYAWRPPAISLGRFQHAETSIDLEECRRSAVDVVRRPTGGRAILHTGDEVTFSIVISEARLGTRGVMDSYRSLATGIVAGLKRLGAEARLVERSATVTPAGPQDPACFAVKARCDLVVGSSKLVGSAQVHRNGVILQQNSLPLQIPLESWSRMFRRRAAAPAAVGLWDAVGTAVTHQQAADGLRAGIEDTFGVRLIEDELSPAERDRAAQIALQLDVLADIPLSHP